MPKETILVVEDEEDILELIRYNLAKEGYQVLYSYTGEDGLVKAFNHSPSLVLLDLMLPGLDGLEVCKRLKRDPRSQHIPIIMVTARGEEADVVTGLELGADDYITKPFSPRVLLARIRSVLRRRSQSPEESNDPLSIHDVVIHPGRHEVTVKGKRVELTATEFRILQYLARRPGWVFTRYQIVDAVHGQEYPVTERSIDVQIAALRKKLGTSGKYIETVRGVGYRFKE